MPPHRLAFLFAAVALVLPSASQGQDGGTFADQELRAPLEIRDEHVLAQERLTLPAVGPDPVGAGITRLRTSFLWGNSFSWTQDVPGETPADRRFLIDGETRTVDLQLTHGLSSSADLSLRVPLRWRGGGSLDGFIDAWHRMLAFLDIQDGGRPSFRRDAFRVEGVTTASDPFSWSGRTGLGLGDIELTGRVRLHERDTSVALVGRLSFPTSSEPFEGSFGGGLQLVARRPLGQRFDLHAGVGGTVEGDPDAGGLAYEPARVHAFAALAYRPWSKVALSLETNLASRLVRDIDRYPGVHWLVNGGVKLALLRGAVLELGLTENIKSQLNTTDFALYVAATVRP